MLTDLAYPLQIENGSLKLATDAEVIKQHILSWLETEPNERVMRPLYGTPNYLFESLSSTDVVAIDLQRNLTAEIPQADFNVTADLQDEGNLLITIFWTTDQFGDQDPITVQVSD